MIRPPIINVMEGANLAMEGDVMKGAEKAVPVKLLQNVIKAARYSEEGMTDKRGEPILDADKFDAFDLLMRASGFSTIQESKYYEAYSRMYQLKSSVDDAKNDLLRRYAQAKLGRNNAEVTRLRAEIREFNRRNRDRDVRITPRSLNQAVQNRRKARSERTEAGLRGGRQYRPYLEDVRFANEG